MIKTNLKNFLTALKQLESVTKYACSNSILKGACMTFYNDFIELVTTDGNRLRLRRVYAEIAQYLTNKQVIIDDIKNVVALLKPFENFKNIELIIKIKDNKLFFEINDNIFNIPIIDGQYPQYKQLIKGYNADFNAKNFDNEHFKIALSRKFLEDICKNMQKTRTESITLSFKDSISSPVYINNNSSIDNVMEFEMLMPIILRG